MMRVTSLLIVAASAMLAGCSTNPLPVDKACGVITDSLSDVRGRIAKGDQRISEHFERGVRAGCWDRTGADKLDVSAPVVLRPATYEKRTTAQRILRRPAKYVPAPVDGNDDETLAPVVVTPATEPVPPPKKSRWQRFKDRIRHPIRGSGD